MPKDRKVLATLIASAVALILFASTALAQELNLINRSFELPSVCAVPGITTVTTACLNYNNSAFPFPPDPTIGWVNPLNSGGAGVYAPILTQYNGTPVQGIDPTAELQMSPVGAPEGHQDEITTI